MAKNKTPKIQKLITISEYAQKYDVLRTTLSYQVHKTDKFETVKTIGGTTLIVDPNIE